MDASILYPATLVIVGLVVLVLVVYLIGIIIALRKAGTHLENLAGGLQKIADNSKPLPKHLDVINEQLTKLSGGLSSVDNHLASIARIFKL
jgi:uncharacterized protein YoxC